MKVKYKNLIKLLSVLLALITVLSSCGGSEGHTEHKDENLDGKCDTCGEILSAPPFEGEGEKYLFSVNGDVKYQLVTDMNSSNSSVYSECKRISDHLADHGMELSVVGDRADNITEYEILVGDISSRGEEYSFDYRSLGPNGRAVTPVKNKILIVGGSEDALIKALMGFFENVIEGAHDVKNIEIDPTDKKHCYINAQKPTDYKWSGATIDGVDAAEYVIAADLKAKLDGTKVYENAAEYIQLSLYENSGRWLPIIDTSDESADIPNRAIIIKFDGSVKYDGGFTVKMSGESLVISTCYPARLEKSVQKFMDPHLLEDNFEIAPGIDIKEELRYVYYEEFGAIGNGRVNDYAAMKQAHDYANKYGHIIKAAPGANYRIAELNGGGSIIIKTDVIWTGATITVDDSVIDTDGAHNEHVFHIAPDHSRRVHSASSELVKSILASGGLKTTTDKLPYAPGYPAMLIPYDKDHKVYIRYGINENAGNEQHELVLIDENGNIDESTPFLLDYSNISYIEEYRVDDRPITIEGGTLVTVSNRSDVYTYYQRNILINRSNVTMRNIDRRVVGEGECGSAYGGMYYPYCMNDLLIENCGFQARRYYHYESEGMGLGTYDIGGKCANKLYFKDCYQVNFMTPDRESVNVRNLWYNINTGEGGLHNDGSGNPATLWGVQGSNYCKNMTYDNCKLNRFDAHAGVYNASVINGCEIINIHLIGGGTARISDTRVYNYAVLTLRTDYGSTWRGDVIMDNVTLVTENSEPRLIQATWANWYFGYETYLPNLTVSGFKLENSITETAYVFSTFATEDFYADRVTQDSELYGDKLEGVLVENRNKPNIPKSVTVKNSEGVRFEIAKDQSSFLLEEIEIIYDE